MKGHRDLTIVTGATAFCALTALLVPLEAVRLAAAAPLCLVLPGYAITSAVFAPSPLERPLALLLCVGLSLTTLATGALVLHLLPGGVRGPSWAALLFVVVLVGCAVAARRRPPSGRVAPHSLPRVWRFRLPSSAVRLRRADGALLAAGAICAFAALALSWMTLPAENAVGYTQLWMLPAEGPASAGVRVGVVNAEPDPLGYRLEVRQEGGEAPVVSRFRIGPGDDVTRFVEVRAPRADEPVRVTARLYRRDIPEGVYRRVSAWVPGG
jgi:uncharacterized membrane protein